MNGHIFGYSWEDIQDMQQGRWKRRIHIDLGKPCPIYDNLPCGTRESDIQLMCEIGIQGLQDEKYFGILDRLSRSGIIEWKAEEGWT